VNIVVKILGTLLILSVVASSCKKDKLLNDSSARLHFSQDSVLFDTVFTSIGSSTRNIRVINKNNQRIKISDIRLQNGSASQFKINVDGAKGVAFSDIEIAANDSIYIFIQVNVNPSSTNSPFIIEDKILFNLNGNVQTFHLEAWGQNAYYHRPTNAIKFSDGSYFPYSRVSELDNAVVTLPNDKPHVVYGFLVVDSSQKLIINAGTKFYMNYKAGLWVFKDGEVKMLGQKGNEIIFQGVRREKDYADEPGQWDRIWINEGSNDNVIDYAIIKNGFIGIQTELLGSPNTTITSTFPPRRLKLTNTKIQNMSLWGLYSLAYNIYGGNNVISNCEEHSLNLQLGGRYTFLHCTFSNFWSKDKAREKPSININNVSSSQVFPLDSAYFGNCIIDGSLNNEINLDLDYSNPTFQPKFWFSSSYLKTNINTADGAKFIDIRKGSSLDYKDKALYNFELTNYEPVKNFTATQATIDAGKFPSDINAASRNTSSVTAGAYSGN
jgi:hypothetical protein